MDKKTGDALQNRLQTAQDYDVLDVNIFMVGEPASAQLSNLAALADAEGFEAIDAQTAVTAIQSQSAEDQRDLLAFLAGRTGSAFVDGEVTVGEVGAVDAFWVTNSVAAELSVDVLREVLARPDVAYVELARHVDIEELLDAPAAAPKPAGSGKRARKPKKPAPAADTATWSVKLIHAPLLWQMGIDGKDVVVAVIDTGINYQHPDLKTHMWDGGPSFPKHGYDFASNDLDPFDEQGHGTAAAGQVAGDGAQGTRTGVAPGATIMALRVGGRERNFWKAFEFAIDHGARVISMSMSWKFPSNPDYPGWRRACETLLAAGIVHANSIGNQGSDLVNFPIPYNIATPGNCPPPRLHPLQAILGGLSSVIACGATDDSDQLASYSGRGPAAWENGPFTDYPHHSGNRPGLIRPDVCAPGPGTISCNWQYPQQPGVRPYVSFGGTSAATPHVAGCLALLVQACRRAGAPIVPARIQEALENTAVRILGQTRDKENHYGAGRVDVYAAYKYGVARSWWN